MYIQINKLIASRWAEELAARTGKSIKAIKSQGLTAQDFPPQTVQVDYADGSRIAFRNALVVQRRDQDEMAVISRDGAAVELKESGTRTVIIAQSH